MSVQDGVVETSLDWRLMSNQTISVKYTLFAHRVQPNLGIVRLDVTGLSNDSTVAVTDVFDVSVSPDPSDLNARRAN